MTIAAGRYSQIIGQATASGIGIVNLQIAEILVQNLVAAVAAASQIL
jgi:hypothetical protein